ncbi:M4 family metallopeptidase [Pseudoalteromonas piscicida]|uniref:M4 family metallopeptidase n=1 Tax=Pseudoalteromonas piscicida TaxID=43662 RepID=UPI001C9860A2|nr:M4 family metallopeptidase [Pseudoalteromonas piscicida]QZO11923.1 M4 family metallopeptidase [Pseudoalteromonas piscicida]
MRILGSICALLLSSTPALAHTSLLEHSYSGEQKLQAHPNVTTSAFSYHAVATMTGNYKIGLNCHQAPNMRTQLCENAVLPLDHPMTKARWPDPPIRSKLFFRPDSFGAFETFSGYPMIVKLEQGKCLYENEWITTYDVDTDSEPYSYPCPSGVVESHGIDSDPYLYYSRFGVFKPVNDAHLFAGVTVQTILSKFKELYPQQSQFCEDNGYCVNPFKVRLGGDSDYSSSWDGEFINLAPNQNANLSRFSHGTSLDIVAHEMGHAILEWNTNNIVSDVNAEPLETRSQRLAFHESFADIFAMGVKDYYARHLSATPPEGNWKQSDAYQKLYSDDENMWGIGWDAFVRDLSLRNVKQPRLDGVSIDDYRDYDDVTQSHFRAGALNKFFYLLASQSGWGVERAFSLVIKAMISCFDESTDMAHATQCIIESADEQDKTHLRQLAQKVGFHSQKMGIEPLKVDMSRLLEEVHYQITDPRIQESSVETLIIHVDDELYYSWSESSGIPWEAAHKATLTLSAGEHSIRWQIIDKNGNQFTSERIAFLINSALCVPENVAASNAEQLKLNGESFDLENGYTSVVLQDDIFIDNPQILKFARFTSGRFIKVLLDKDRNGFFDEQSETVLSRTELGNKLTFSLEALDALQQGPVLLRVIIEEAEGSSTCFLNESAQVIDVKSSVKGGTYQPPSISFSYTQLNQLITLNIQEQFSDAYSFKWTIGRETIETRSYTLTRELDEGIEVKLDLIRDDVTVKSISKVVVPISVPNIAIQCQQNERRCLLQSVHSEIVGALKYRWNIDGEIIERSNNTPFEYEFADYGEHSVKLSLLLNNDNVQFDHSQVIELHQVPTVDVVIKQTNDLFSFTLSQLLPEGYEIIWVIDGVEYRGVDKTLNLKLKENVDSVSYRILKGDVVVKQQDVAIVKVPDPNLKFKCKKAEGLRCSFTVEHDQIPSELTYYWSFGDEATLESTDPNVSHAYNQEGIYAVKLSLRVDQHADFTATKIVNIHPTQPPLVEPKINFSQYNNVIKLQAIGEGIESLEFKWLINDVALEGKEVEQVLANLGEDYDISLQIFYGGQKLMTLAQPIYIHKDIALEFDWELVSKDGGLPAFDFSVSHLEAK